MRLPHFLLTVFAATCIHALAPANPHGWDEFQPDGTPAGRFYLKGHPYEETGVYTVDQNQHPVVRDEDGWFVYASVISNSTVDEGQRKRELWLPTEHRVSLGSAPPRHLKKRYLETFGTPVRLTMDLMCTPDMPKSQWCPNNKMPLGRSIDPLTRGTTKVIVILVRFTDHLSRPMPSKRDYEAFFNSENNDPDITPTGSVNQFFKVQSLYQYAIEGHVQEWSVAPNTEQFHSYGLNGMTSLFAKVAQPALDRMDEEGTDWSQYDRDGDGVLDSVVILHSGFSAEGGGTDCINNKEMGSHRIWSHRTSASGDTDGWSSKDKSIQLGRYATASAVHGYCGNNITRIGIVGHEMMHLLGLPDMLTTGSQFGHGVGVYDVMGQMWGVDGTQYHPATLSPWSRMQLGWVNPQRINESGIYYLRTSQTYPDVYRIDSGFPEGEYLLIENRQKIMLDAAMPGEGGILIWHVDENMEGSWMEQPGFPNQEGWPGNGRHYQVALISPDSSYDLEMNVNVGDATDYWCSDCWTNASLALQPGPARKFSRAEEANLYPNTDAYSNGDVRNSMVTVYDFSPIGTTMSFRLSTTATQPPPTPLPTTLPTLIPMQALTDLPTKSPTSSPTSKPTRLPTVSPTESPTWLPTSFPTASPTADPTLAPTPLPSASPTWFPTSSPTTAPTPQTPRPTGSTPAPSKSPTASPMVSLTSSPTGSPTADPTIQPTASPTVFTPVQTQDNIPFSVEQSDVTASPTLWSPPTLMPTIPSSTSYPTLLPTFLPTTLPPSSTPTWSPSAKPTNPPTRSPSISPSVNPSKSPSSSPSVSPTASQQPTLSMQPSNAPTRSAAPSSTPSNMPSSQPTWVPSSVPSDIPSQHPSNLPSASLRPSNAPSGTPSNAPTDTPSSLPSISPLPSRSPSGAPLQPPSTLPTVSPTPSPTELPTVSPTGSPAKSSTGNPIEGPTEVPTDSRDDLPGDEEYIAVDPFSESPENYGDQDSSDPEEQDQHISRPYFLNFFPRRAP